MKKHKKKLIIIGIIIGIILIVIISDKRKITFIEKGIKDGYTFIIKAISNNCENNCEDIEQVELLKAENNQLKKDIDNLKDLLKLETTLSEYKTINATVVDRNLGYWYDTLTIDKGQNDGVKENDAVISPKGLIGYIESVNYESSTVKLITSNLKNKISVKISMDDKEIFGLLNSYKDGYFIIEGVSEDVKEGMIVTTAGLGNNYPEGIYIGKISEITTDNFDLVRTLKVKSDMDYNLITLVSVVSK